MANFNLLANLAIDKGLMKGHVKCLSKAMKAEENKDPLWALQRYVRFAQIR